LLAFASNVTGDLVDRILYLSGMSSIFISELENYLHEQELPGLKGQLLMAPAGRDFTRSDGVVMHAAVMLVLFKRNETFRLILTRRHDYDGPHSGQVSLPGGKTDLDDMGFEYTAFRETHEEIGIKPEELRIIGKLTDLFIPVSRYMVHPYIAYSENIPVCEPDPGEVKYILEVKLDDLLEEQNRKIKTMNLRGSDYEVPYLFLKGETVWGATAMILSEFIEIVRPLYSRFQQ
jgi:8-oxo-dGTP pyrophosphatase MutT (NUDIX family)